MELAYLDFDAAVRLNVIHGGPGAGVADAGGIEAVLARPLSGFGDVETFPTPWLKAAALLHGFATTQYFADGNKRTAFLAATTFLEANGFDLAVFDPIQSEAFVYAVALKALDVAKIAEWLEVAHQQRRRGLQRDPRLEYVTLARATSLADGDGTASALGIGVGGFVLNNLPTPTQLSLLARVHWDEADMGRGHRFDMLVRHVGTEQEEDPIGGVGLLIDAPARGGHPHQPGGRIPHLVTMNCMILLEHAGEVEVEVLLDDDLAAVLPFTVTYVPPLSFGG